MPPRDPNLPEGTDSIFDDGADIGGTGSSLGAGSLGSSSTTGSGTGGFDDDGFGGSSIGGSSIGGSIVGGTGVGGSSVSGSGVGGSGLGSSGIGSSGVGETSSYGGTGGSLGDKVEQAADRAGATMDIQSIKSQATDKVRDVASQGKERATEALSQVSQLVSETANTVDDRLGPQYGNYVRKAGEAIDNFGETIRTKQVDELFDDARDLVRKSPAVAIGAAAAIGFLLIRLVKSGMPQTVDQRDDYYARDNSTLQGLPPRVDSSYDPVA